MAAGTETLERREKDSPARRGSRTAGGRRWLVRAGLVVVGLLLPLVLVELALRLFGPILPGNYETGRWAERHPVFGHFHIPNASAWLREPEFSVHLRFNRFGLRGPDVPLERSPGIPRVLMLGDSFIEAKQVAEAQTVAARLQAATGAEWLNSGTFDWGPVQQYLYLQHEGVQFRPDLVVQFVYLGNDVADNVPRSRGAIRRLGYPAAAIDEDTGELELLPWTSSPPTTDDRISEIFGGTFATYRAYETGVRDKVRYQNVNPYPMERHLLDLFREKEPAALGYAWKVVDALLGSIQQEAARGGAPTLLVIVPTKWQVHADDWRGFLKHHDRGVDDGWDLSKPNRRLAELAAARGIPVLDLQPALRAAADEGKRLYYAVDMHWTAEGHAVAARELERYLAETGQLAGR